MAQQTQARTQHLEEHLFLCPPNFNYVATTKILKATSKARKGANSAFGDLLFDSASHDYKVIWEIYINSDRMGLAFGLIKLIDPPKGNENYTLSRHHLLIIHN